MSGNKYKEGFSGLLFFSRYIFFPFYEGGK